jgi:hypothetical protein
MFGRKGREVKWQQQDDGDDSEKENDVPYYPIRHALIKSRSFNNQGINNIVTTTTESDD